MALFKPVIHVRKKYCNNFKTPTTYRRIPDITHTHTYPVRASRIRSYVYVVLAARSTPSCPIPASAGGVLLL